MPPDERRAMLIAATLPLVAEHGTKVTTRQIAAAAGVAEGTIFRVFPDKDALVNAAVAHALDPTSAIAELRAVDLGLPLRVRLLQLTSILQRQLILVFNVMMATCQHAPPPDVAAHRETARPTNALILAEIARLLEPDRDRFRLPVAEVARLLRLLTFSGSHPLISDGNLLTADEIVRLLLDGVQRRPGDHAADTGGTDKTDTKI